jgi:enterochelin esterase-like enzyme
MTKSKIQRLVAITVLLAACSQTLSNDIVASTATTKAILSSAESVPTDTALAIQLSKDAAAATAMAGCPSNGGEIKQVKIESQYLDAGMRFRVYTPPCYKQESDRHYPVLYLIHGQTFTDDQWDRLEADETATQLIATGEISPFLIVMPYDISSNQPSFDHFGESVVEELLPWIDEHYRTLTDTGHRAIGGLSRGASWAIHLGLTHPELFASVGGHSPPIFVEDAPHVRTWLDEIPTDLMPRFWLDIGDRDQRAIMDSATWFEGLLDERDIVHEWSLFSGDHSETYWKAHVEMYLRWYAQDW